MIDIRGLKERSPAMVSLRVWGKHNSFQVRNEVDFGQDEEIYGVESEMGEMESSVDPPCPRMRPRPYHKLLENNHKSYNARGLGGSAPIKFRLTDLFQYQNLISSEYIYIY